MLFIKIFLFVDLKYNKHLKCIISIKLSFILRVFIFLFLILKLDIGEFSWLYYYFLLETFLSCNDSSQV